MIMEILIMTVYVVFCIGLIVWLVVSDDDDDNYPRGPFDGFQ